MDYFGALFERALRCASFLEEDRGLGNLLQIEPERVEELLLNVGRERVKQRLATHVCRQLFLEVR